MHTQRWKLFFQASRFFHPAGTLLLFWPCLWGYLYGTQGQVEVWALMWCFFGAFWMRSVGCVYNDWVDAPFDRFVARTRNRPLVFREEGWQAPLLILCVVFGVTAIITLPLRVLGWGALGWGLSLIYPWAKRYVIPQYVLGILFAWGVWVGAAMSSIPSLISCWRLYTVAVLWVIEYDTVYSAQDRWDDQKLGLKSTVTFAGQNTRRFLQYLILTRSIIMVLISLHSIPAIILGIILGSISYVHVNRISFIETHSCKQYFAFQAWVQGALLSIWVGQIS